MKTLWMWSKISSVKWEDAWEERLAFLPPGHLSMVTSPGSRALRMRAYGDRATVTRLHKYFGGSVRELPEEEYNRELGREIAPLKVRDRLVVASSKADWKRLRALHPRRAVIHIPASMAFGTGSHPTTAGCLRLLCDESAQAGSGWSMADLGCGSGILAIAGKKLGASPVIALDYDPVCIKHTRANARTNKVVPDRIERADVLHWEAGRAFRIITANLFSDTLILASERIAQAIEPGGALIFSGVLREQFSGVRAAIESAGLRMEGFNNRGKWVCGLARKPSGKS